MIQFGIAEDLIELVTFSDPSIYLWILKVRFEVSGDAISVSKLFKTLEVT